MSNPVSKAVGRAHVHVIKRAARAIFASESAPFKKTNIKPTASLMYSTMRQGSVSRRASKAATGQAAIRPAVAFQHKHITRACTRAGDNLLKHTENSMSDNDTFHSKLEQSWANGVERATNEYQSATELTNEKLTRAAGVAIHSGIKSGGLWGSTSGQCGSNSCQNCFTANCE
jgi:phosphatidate phosphatase PAH1